MDNRNNGLEISGIHKFLSVIRDVLDKSYAIEFGSTSKDWLNDNSSIVLQRGALFTIVKDSYESLSSLEKKRVDKL